MSVYEMLCTEIEIEILKSDRDQHIGLGGRNWQHDSFTAFSVNEIDQKIATLTAHIESAQ